MPRCSVTTRWLTASGRNGYLPGDFAGYPDLTGSQFLKYLANLRGGVSWAGIESLSKRLELDLDVRMGSLSHGNRQKVGIVQAFMHDPELLILDEPTSGLDPLVQREFLQLIREVRDRGRTVFLSSHILSEVEAVADVVAILRRGRLVVTDTVANLEHQAVRRLDLVFRDTPPLAEIMRVPGVHDIQATERTIHLAIEGSTAELIRAAAPYGVENVITHEPDLEDVFLGWYDAGEAG